MGLTSQILCLAGDPGALQWKLWLFTSELPPEVLWLERDKWVYNTGPVSWLNGQSWCHNHFIQLINDISVANSARSVETVLWIDSLSSPTLSLEDCLSVSKGPMEVIYPISLGELCSESTEVCDGLCSRQMLKIITHHCPHKLTSWCLFWQKKKVRRAHYSCGISPGAK